MFNRHVAVLAFGAVLAAVVGIAAQAPVLSPYQGGQQPDLCARLYVARCHHAGGDLRVRIRAPAVATGISSASRRRTGRKSSIKDPRPRSRIRRDTVSSHSAKQQQGRRYRCWRGTHLERITPTGSNIRSFSVARGPRGPSHRHSQCGSPATVSLHPLSIPQRRALKSKTEPAGQKHDVFCWRAHNALLSELSGLGV